MFERAFNKRFYVDVAIIIGIWLTIFPLSLILGSDGEFSSEDPRLSDFIAVALPLLTDFLYIVYLACFKSRYVRFVANSEFPQDEHFVAMGATIRFRGQYAIIGETPLHKNEVVWAPDKPGYEFIGWRVTKGEEGEDWHKCTDIDERDDWAIRLDGRKWRRININFITPLTHPYLTIKMDYDKDDDTSSKPGSSPINRHQFGSQACSF